MPFFEGDHVTNTAIIPRERLEKLEARIAELEGQRDRLLLMSQSALNYLISHGVPDLDVVTRILAEGLAENRVALAGREE